MILALTGATGFVGSTVLERARRDGLHLRALTRREQAAQPGVEWVRGDLEDKAALAALTDKADCVLHIAGLTNASDRAAFDRANVEGTRNLVEAAQAGGAKRFVLVSSVAAREPQLSDYGASKRAAEELIKPSGLAASIVRPPAVYGPRDTEMFELFRAARLGLIPLPPGGATSIIHAQDLADLLLTLALDPAADPGASVPLYEPDDGREGGWAHGELAQAIGKAVGRSRVFAPALPQAVLQLAARADKLVRGRKAKLTADRVGYMCHPNWVVRSAFKPPAKLWQPAIAGEEGLAMTACWYEREGWFK